jgi:RNA polymerase sigma factor (sigma-70 family)
MSSNLQALDWPDLLALLHDWKTGQPSPPSVRETQSQAWNELRRRVELMAREYIFSAALSHSDAEDIAQSTLLKLQRKTIWRRLRTARSIQGYLHTMVRNQAIDLLRHRSVERAWLDTLSGEPLEEDAGGVPEPSASMEKLRGLLAALSVEEKKLLRWRFWDGLGLDEISDQLGVPYSTAAGRMFRLLNKLRQNWEADE